MHNFSSLEKYLNVVLPKFISLDFETKWREEMSKQLAGRQGCNETFSVIYQQSLLIREVPVDWKSANVMSIYKEGQKGDLGNHKPVSLTLVPRKVMEQISWVPSCSMCRTTRGSGPVSPPKVLSSIITGYPGKCWGHHLWKDLKLCRCDI